MKQLRHPFSEIDDLEVFEKNYSIPSSKKKNIKLISRNFTGTSCALISRKMLKILYYEAITTNIDVQLDWWISYLRNIHRKIFVLEPGFTLLSPHYKQSQIKHTKVISENTGKDIPFGMIS